VYEDPFLPSLSESLPTFVVVSLITAILTRVRWNLNILLIYNSFMVKAVVHFFMYLFAICTSFFFRKFQFIFPFTNCIIIYEGSSKLKNRTTIYEPAIPLLSTYLKECKST
jgi:hypothetical protein